MDNTSSDWKISTARRVAWLILCLGIFFNIFVIRNAGIVVFNRVLAEQVIQRQNAGQSEDTSQMESFINFNQLLLIFIAGIIAVALTVMIDYYLRVAEKWGRLFKRIGLVAGIELGVYGLAMLIQIYI